jgi:hypothetical protein
MQSRKTWLRNVGSVGLLFICMIDILIHLITLYCWPKNLLFKIAILQRIRLVFVMFAADVFSFLNTPAEINFHMVASVIDTICPI